MKWKNAALASAVAGMFIAGVAHHAVAGDPEGAEAKVKCEGVNSCKGQSDCKTASSKCSGHNSCKGKGHLNVTKKECDALKAKMKSEEKS